MLVTNPEEQVTPVQEQTEDVGFEPVQVQPAEIVPLLANPAAKEHMLEFWSEKAKD